MPNETRLDTAPPKDLRVRPAVAEDEPNLDPISGEPGAHPVGTGVGAGGGALAGAALGAVGGPIGLAAGAIVGAVGGGLVGKEVAEVIDPTAGGRPEQHQVGTGIGASAGALGGAALGSAIAGPVGLAAGAALGAMAGGAAGKGVARVVNPVVEDTYWRASYVSTSYCLPERTYEDYGPAYRLGYDGWASCGGTFAESEDGLSREWDSVKGQSRLSWNEAKHAARAAWERVDRPIPLGSERW